MKITIPFKTDMSELIYTGKKTCTTRTIPYGKTGDIFKIKNKWFKIIKITRITLGKVILHYYKLEGFNTPHDFVNYWLKLNPTRKWTAKDKVYIHIIMEVI